MMIQQELYMYKPEAHTKPDILAANMLEILRHRRCWMTRKDFKNYGFTDRQCRLAREHAKGKIIYGQRGFKASSCALKDEIMECYNTLMSQAKTMEEEARELMREYHNG